MSKQTVVIRPPVTIKFDGDKCEEECFDSFAAGTHICSAFACLPVGKVVVRVEGNVAYRCQACKDAVREANETASNYLLALEGFYHNCTQDMPRADRDHFLEIIERLRDIERSKTTPKDTLIKKLVDALEACHTVIVAERFTNDIAIKTVVLTEQALADAKEMSDE